MNTKPIRYPGNVLQPYDGRNAIYIAAELNKTFVNENCLFTVGDGKKYGRSSTRKRRNIQFYNVKLQPGTHYSVLQRTFKTAVSGKLMCTFYSVDVDDYKFHSNLAADTTVPRSYTAAKYENKLLKNMRKVRASNISKTDIPDFPHTIFCRTLQVLAIYTDFCGYIH